MIYSCCDERRRELVRDHGLVNGVDYIFGLGGNDVLDRNVEAAAEDVRVRWAEGELPVVRRYAETRYGAASWKCERRVAARIEASSNGLDIRYVVTNIRRGSAEWLYDTLYCARGQAENLIKLHKTQLASDRTSCRSALANQVRLVPPYRRLLVDADRARRHSQSPGIGHSRVCGAASSALENRCPCRRDHEPRLVRHVPKPT